MDIVRRWRECCHQGPVDRRQSTWWCHDVRSQLRRHRGQMFTEPSSPANLVPTANHHLRYFELKVFRLDTRRLCFLLNAAVPLMCTFCGFRIGLLCTLCQAIAHVPVCCSSSLPCGCSIPQIESSRLQPQLDRRVLASRPKAH